MILSMRRVIVANYNPGLKSYHILPSPALSVSSLVMMGIPRVERSPSASQKHCRDVVAHHDRAVRQHATKHPIPPDRHLQQLLFRIEWYAT